MKISFVEKFLVASLIAFVFVSPASAQEGAESVEGKVVAPQAGEQSQPTQGSASADEEKDEFAVLKPGTIASTGSQPGNAALSVSSGGAVPGDELMPVAASISRKGREACEVKVTNNHEKNTYSLNFAVEGTDARGSVASKTTFSATVKPKQSITKSMTCREGLNMRVTLRSGKKV